MKNYVKPELFYESYELSQTIAACGWDMNNTLSSPKNCQATGDPAFGNPNLVVFVESNANCESVFEGYCYENSADNVTIKIFNS